MNNPLKSDPLGADHSKKRLIRASGSLWISTRKPLWDRALADPPQRITLDRPLIRCATTFIRWHRGGTGGKS